MSDFLSLPPIAFETIDMTGKLEKAQHSLKSGRSAHAVESSPAELKETCSELESVFILYLLKEMRATIPKTGLMSGGRAEEIYTSMLDSQIAKEMALQKGIGLSSMLLDRFETQTVEAGEENFKKNESKG